MNKLILITASLLILSCGQKTKSKSDSVTKNTEAEIIEKNTAPQNFAVIWNWTTEDTALVSANSATISEELSNLWKKGFIENAYYNSNSKVDKLSYFPNISFFLKAESYKAAEAILNKLTVVKKGISIYKIFPVGDLWPW